MQYPSALTAGIDVVSSDGHKLGQLHRAVLRRTDLSLSHIVVDVGFLRSGHQLWEGGYGIEYDRLVDVKDVLAFEPERVLLTLTAAQFKEAPQYTATGYEEPHDLTPDEFDLPDVVNRLQALSAMIGNTSNFWIAEHLDKPLDGLDIKEGTPVWRREPHQKLGDVQRLVLDPATGRLRGFVIKRGVLFKHEVLLPLRHVADIMDDLVHVDLDDEAIDQLEPYEEPSAAS